MNIIYFLYTILIATIGTCALVVGGLLTLIVSFLYSPSTYPMITGFAKVFVFILGVRVKIEGEFPENGPYIIMANHTSMLDPFLWGTFMKGKFTGIVANKNMNYPIYGWMLKRMRAVAIDRSNRSESIQRIKNAESVLNDGYHIGLHPEGTRTLSGKMNPLKKGGFHMAKNTNTSILPIGFDGAFNFKPKNRFTLRPTTVTIRIGDIISKNIYDKSSINDLIDITTQKLKKLSGEID
mgnify:FL=1